MSGWVRAASRGRSSRKSRLKICRSRCSEVRSAALVETYPEELLGVVPLVEGGGDVEALVALEANERRVEQLGHDVGYLGLADAGAAFYQQGALQRLRHEYGRGDGRVGDVVAGLQFADDFSDGVVVFQFTILSVAQSGILYSRESSRFLSGVQAQYPRLTPGFGRICRGLGPGRSSGRSARICSGRRRIFS